MRALLLLACWARAPGFANADTPLHAFASFSMVTGLEFGADSTRLLVSGWDVKMWDVASGRLLRDFAMRAGGAALSQDGRRVAAGEKKLEPGSSLLKVWDSGDGSEVLSLDVATHGLNEGVNCVDFSPDGAKVAVAGGAGPVKVFDVASGSEFHSIDIPSGSRVVAFDPSGTTLGIGRTKKLLLWNLETETLAREVDGGDTLYDFAFSSHGQALVLGSGNSRWVKLVNATTGEATHSITHDVSVHSVAISADGAKFASGQADGTVRLFDAGDGTEIRRISGAHDGYVLALAFSPDGTMLASGGQDDTARVWCIAEACDSSHFKTFANLASAGAPFSLVPTVACLSLLALFS